MAGTQDPGCRKCMVWEKEKQDLDLFTHIQKVISLRKNHPAFGNKGTFTFVEADSNVVMYEKTYKEEHIIFSINNKDKEQTFKIPVQDIDNKNVHDLYLDKEMIWSLGKELTLSPGGFSILQFKTSD